MSSSPSHATVTYTSISSDDYLQSRGIPLMDLYESNPKAPEATLQSPEQAPLSLLHAPVYPKYLAPSLSPTALSPDYVADSNPYEEEEEEPLAPALFPSPIPDYVPLFEETKPFEKGETAATLPSPVSPHTVAHIAKYAVAPTPPSPSPSPLSPLSSPLPRIPSPPLLLPSPTRRDIILEADMPPQKRARFDASSRRFEIGKSLTAAAARQLGPTLTRGTELGFMTALDEVKESVIDIAVRHRRDSKEFHTRHQDDHEDKAVLRYRISTLEKERRYHRHMAMVTDHEATYAR
uniref:Uncharacterized protein n=1 Tax=Tanacetum cinerariifolium TaxID=118510 RepID=A0A699GNJ5_TANCI|nr:hypothetical protein [Tanacetum cinerariifolium]